MKQEIDLTGKRYLVIADYPQSEYKVGLIINFPTKESWFSGQDEWVSEVIPDKNGGRSGQRPLSYFEPYPHLFRELDWWEMRDEKDMPEYVKFKKNIWKYFMGDIVPVTNWFRYKDGKVCIYHSSFSIESFLPATENDYNNYIKSLKQTV